MQHRHLNPGTGWTRAAIASLLERGDLPDWRALMAGARRDPALAKRIAEVAAAAKVPGSSVMALRLVEPLLADAPSSESPDADRVLAPPEEAARGRESVPVWRPF